MNENELQQQVKTALHKQLMDTKLGKRNGRQDTIHITPHVTVIEGTPDNIIRHITSGYGRVVENGLKSVTNFLAGANSNGNTTHYFWMSGLAAGSSGIPAVPSIRLGVGTTATAYNTTQAASLNNTVPNSISGSISNPSNGVYTITITATWNAGALGTPTITEIMLYAKADATLRSFGSTVMPNSPDAVLVDRLCSTDGDFTEVEVNGSNPLTVYYTISVSFDAPT